MILSVNKLEKNKTITIYLYVFNSNYYILIRSVLYTEIIEGLK